MKSSIVSLSRAKTELLGLARSMVNDGRSFILTKDGVPVGALIPFEEYETLEESLEVMSNPALMKNLKEALADEASGKLWRRDAKGKWIKIRKH